jgi:hypothetical protein
MLFNLFDAGTLALLGVLAIGLGVLTYLTLTSPR